MSRIAEIKKIASMNNIDALATIAALEKRLAQGRNQKGGVRLTIALSTNLQALANACKDAPREAVAHLKSRTNSRGASMSVAMAEQLAQWFSGVASELRAAATKAAPATSAEVMP